MKFICIFKELHIPTNLKLKEGERNQILAACEAHNQLLRNYTDMEQRHTPAIRAAMYFLLHLQSVDQQLREARSCVTNALHFAEDHFSESKGEDLPPLASQEHFAYVA
jgi:hypothetical protein